MNKLITLSSELKRDLLVLAANRDMNLKELIAHGLTEWVNIKKDEGEL